MGGASDPKTKTFIAVKTTPAAQTYPENHLKSLTFSISPHSSLLHLSLLPCPLPAAIGSTELAIHFSPYDLKRMELYSRSMVDYHLIMDLVPKVARLFFLRQLGDISLSAAQCVGVVPQPSCCFSLRLCRLRTRPHVYIYSPFCPRTLSAVHINAHLGFERPPQEGFVNSGIFSYRK